MIPAVAQTDSADETPLPRKRARGALRSGLAYLFAAACLVWVFRDVDLGKLAAHIERIHWWWVFPAAASEAASYLCEGLRWHSLAAPMGGLAAVRATRAIYIGLLANDVLPLRTGELVRAYVVSRWTERAVSVVLPSLLVGRLLDAVCMAAAIGATALLIQLPAELLTAGKWFGVSVLTLVMLFALLGARSRESVASWATAAPRNCVLASVRRVVGPLALGLREIGASAILGRAAAATFAFHLIQAAAFSFALRAFGIQVGVFAGVTVFLMVHIGTAIPSAPANVGAYQFFTVLGLELFGVDKTIAAAFSVFAFLILTLPLCGLGLLAVRHSGLTLSSIRADIRRP